MTTRTVRLAPNLAMPLDAATETFGIFAVRGRGKTFTSAVLTEQLLAAGVPVVVIDPTGAHWGLRSSADGKRPGFPITIIGGDHADVPLEQTAGKLLAELVAAKRVPLLLDLSHLSKSAMRRFLTDFMETLYLKNRHPLHIIADECDMYCPQRTFAGIEPLLGSMEDVVRRGRKNGLGITLISQRPASVNTSVRSQVGTLILLGLTGTHDIKAVDEWVNLHADPETARKVKASLPSLDTGHAWVWSPQWLRILKQIKVNPRTTFDSSATPKVGESLIPPAEWATVDAAALSAEIAATVERVRENDPKRLRAEIARLRAQITKLENGQPAPAPQIIEVPLMTDEHVGAIEAAYDKLSLAYTEWAEQLSQATALTDEVIEQTNSLQAILKASNGTYGKPPTVTEARPMTRPAPRSAEPPARPPMQVLSPDAAGDVKLRAGAHRMVEALGRMAPLRLTKSQWGTVARLKTSGGTWSTYLSDIRRAGLIDKTNAGYTLTDAGFDYLGGRPEPMTAAELQDHYRTVLRAGAVKMLDALIEAYPDGLTKDALGVAAEIATTGGTFSTYLSDLVRNGLAHRSDGVIVATDVLMRGAQL